MATALVDAHITAQARLRQIVAGAVGQTWASLPGYDERNVDEWLSRALPIVNAGQRQSVALTEAFLAAAIGRAPLGVDVEALIGAGVRAGTAPADVYRRPLVTVWTALGNGADYPAAVAAGLARATSTAEMDVQLSSRQTMQAVQEADDAIYGYQRVADGGACEFCQAVDGAYVKSADAMALHNRCGCSLEPLTAPHPRARFLPSGADVTDKYAVHEHGELGPVLTAPGDRFTSEHQLH